MLFFAEHHIHNCYSHHVDILSLTINTTGPSQGGKLVLLSSAPP